MEIAEDVLEEVVQNALIHRDLLRSAPIRIFIFDNRVEIVSPGALAGGLTIDDICNGKTFQRNPFMAVFATNALRYRGIGSGIVRILKENKNITFMNDDNGKEFTAIIRREVMKKETENSDKRIESNEKLTEKQLQLIEKLTERFTENGDKLTENRQKILLMMIADPYVSKEVLAQGVGISIAAISSNIEVMRGKYLQRVGPDKGGHWEIIEKE